MGVKDGQTELSTACSSRRSLLVRIHRQMPQLVLERTYRQRVAASATEYAIEATSDSASAFRVRITDPETSGYVSLRKG